MPSLLDDPSQRPIMDWLDGEHLRYRCRADAAAKAGEVVLNDRWRLDLQAAPTALTLRMAQDFQRFANECLLCGLQGAGDRGPAVTWRLDPRRTADIRFSDPNDTMSFDRSDPAVESFVLEVAQDGIAIVAGHERGLLQGTHYLERLMADRGGPYLTPGVTEHRPAMTPRISNGVFVPARQSLADLGHFSDDYLALMSHFAVNGIHIYIHLSDLCRNEALPQLNTPDYAHNISLLNAFNQRLLVHGIDLYLHINTGTFPADNPVFQDHPEVRGSRIDIFLEQLEGVVAYNLCSSSDRVLESYRQALTNLFNDAPRLAGGVLLIGGESFYHCFTRPSRDADGRISCPRCRSLDASASVGHLVNHLASAIKRTGSHKLSFAWPYSAFVWSGDDRDQLRWIDSLSPDVSLLSNFDCGDVDQRSGGGAVLFDYNIKVIGPSGTFAAQARRRHEARQPIFTKTESNTTPMAHFLPYLPVHHRWACRFAAMREQGVAGYIGQWRFFGMNGSPPEELQYHAVWNPARSADDVLAVAAQRDFGVDHEAAKRIVAGWSMLSDAWDHFPWSAMTCGEREAYMRGPFYLGPAHPLIFNPQDDYQLLPAFRSLRGDAAELLDPEALQEAVRRAKPRYVSDLLFTLPFGIDRYLQLTGDCLTQWSAGVSVLESELAGTASTRAVMELDICRTIQIHLTTLHHVARFYQHRDSLWQTPRDVHSFNAIVATLRQIVRDEIANAARALPILQRDVRIGYGFTYGRVYGLDMVSDKIRQCNYVLEQELPRVSDVVRFHVWNDWRGSETEGCG